MRRDVIRPLPFALLPIVGLAWAPAAGRAAPAPLLAWEAPAEGCPSPQEVSERLRTHLGPGADGESAPALRARVERVEAGGWRAQIESPEGRRTIAGESCDALADAVVAVAALVVRPSSSGQEGRARPGAGAGARPAEAPGVPRFVHVGAGFWGNTAALPAAAVGAGVQGGLRWGRLRAEVGGAIYPRRERELTSDPRVGGRVGLSTLLAQGCFAPYDRAWRLEGCAGGEVGVLSGEGFGAETVREQRRGWYAVQAGVGASWSPAPHLMLRAQGGAVVPLARPRFLIEGAGEVHRPPAAGARLFLGVDTFF